MYFGGIPKMTTLKKLLQNMKSVMQTRSFRQILMLCLMLIGLLVVYFIYVRKYNVNKREGAADGGPETEKEMNEKVDEYLERLNACTNLDPDSSEYTLRREQQDVLAKEIKAGFEQKIEKINELKYDKDIMQKELNDEINELQGANLSIRTQLNGLERAHNGLKEEYAGIKTNLASNESRYIGKKVDFKSKLDKISKLAGKIKAVIPSDLLKSSELLNSSEQVNSSEQLNTEDTQTT